MRRVKSACFFNFGSVVHYLNKNNYYSFTETYYADVANSGYANPVTDKVRVYASSANFSFSLYGSEVS